jgi:hypothetical protein
MGSVCFARGKSDDLVTRCPALLQNGTPENLIRATAALRKQFPPCREPVHLAYKTRPADFELQFHQIESSTPYPFCQQPNGCHGMAAAGLKSSESFVTHLAEPCQERDRDSSNAHYTDGDWGRVVGAW